MYPRIPTPPPPGLSVPDSTLAACACRAEATKATAGALRSLAPPSMASPSAGNNPLGVDTDCVTGVGRQVKSPLQLQQRVVRIFNRAIQAACKDRAPEHGHLGKTQ